MRRALARAGSAADVYASGIGAQAAMQTAHAALVSHAPPRAALITGLCGATSPALGSGDVLVYAGVRRCADARAGRDAPVASFDAALVAQVAQRVLPHAQTGIRACDSGTIVAQPHQKRLLGTTHGVEALDMETFALVDWLSRAGVATAAVRVASDGVDDELPDFGGALDGVGGIDPLRLGLAFARRPCASLRFISHAIGALRNLERSVFEIVRPG